MSNSISPKAKAAMMVTSFLNILLGKLKYMYATLLAKQCATAAVDEILSAIDWHEFETPNKELEYWNEVKKSIEQL